MLRLAGKGLPDVNGYGRGDILVVVDVTVPAKLNAEEKRLVEQLAAQPSFQRAEASKGHQHFRQDEEFLPVIYGRKVRSPGVTWLVIPGVFRIFTEEITGLDGCIPIGRNTMCCRLRIFCG